MKRTKKYKNAKQFFVLFLSENCFENNCPIILSTTLSLPNTFLTKKKKSQLFVFVLEKEFSNTKTVTKSAQ
jgi:hypothetical protein